MVNAGNGNCRTTKELPSFLNFLLMALPYQLLNGNHKLPFLKWTPAARNHTAHVPLVLASLGPSSGQTYAQANRTTRTGRRTVCAALSLMKRVGCEFGPVIPKKNNAGSEPPAGNLVSGNRCWHFCDRAYYSGTYLMRREKKRGEIEIQRK